MRVGVTGGAGFIGGHVVDALHFAGHDTVVFDHLGRVGDSVGMLGDVRDSTAVHELAAHVDGVIHLAAVLGTQETIGNPMPAAETNIMGALNVLQACRHYGLPLVNIAVGNWWMRNTYSTTKHCAERLLEQYRDELGLRAANVRCVNAYGPRQSAAAPFGSARVRKIIPAFACRALAGQPIEVYGDGQQVSDMVHVADVAFVLTRTLELCADGFTPPQTVEVGPVEHATVLEVAQMVAAEAATITGELVDIVHLPMRPGELAGAQVTADTASLRYVGVDPASFIALPQGLGQTVRWFAENRGVTWR